MALQSPVQLEKVFLLQRRPGRFPQLVFRHRVHAGHRHNLRIVTVDDLAVDKGVRVLSTHSRQNLVPKLWVHCVGRIQSPAINPPRQPVIHHVDDKINSRVTGVIEFDQTLMALKHRRGHVAI